MQSAKLLSLCVATLRMPPTLQEGCSCALILKPPFRLKLLYLYPVMFAGSVAAVPGSIVEACWGRDIIYVPNHVSDS